jgi:hypothetical protein
MTAIANLPIALVAINAQLDHARRTLALRLDHEQIESQRRMQPLTQEEIAREHYNERLALDEALRNTSPGWANIGIDDGYVAELRAAVAGRLTDEEMTRLVGSTLHRFQLRGNISAQPHSPEWRKIGRAVAAAELEVLERMFQRDEGTMLTEADHPAHLIAHDTTPTAEPFVEPVSLRALLQAYLRGLEASGRGRSARKAWVPVFEDLDRSLCHGILGTAQFGYRRKHVQTYLMARWPGSVAIDLS